MVRGVDGTPYVKVGARVHYVRRDARSRAVRNVTLDMLDADGESLRKLSVRPPRGFRVKVDGKEYSADYLATGTELGLYLPPNRWEVVWSAATATPIDTQVFIEDIETQLVTTSLEADKAFEFDSAELSDDGRSDLDAILEISGGYVPAITIVGHTDKIGDDEYNLDLSKRRANAAKNYLVSQGVPAWRITAVGRGEENPVVECEGLRGDELVSCLAPNRRAEVAFLVPAVAEAASVQVTKTYVKPLGEKVVISEDLRVARIEEIKDQAKAFLKSCKAEIENFCGDVLPGDGRLVGCLAANRQPDVAYSEGCDSAMQGVMDSVLNRRARLNAVGSACSAEIAACDAAPLGGKLECVATGLKSDRCSEAMSNLAAAAL